MNIQSISELNGLSVGINLLSASNPRAFVEVSRQPSKNADSYTSYKLDLHVFLSSIIDMVSYLSSQIKDLNTLTTAIRNNYVPLTGNVRITGPIEINPGTNIANKANLMVRGPLAVRGSLDIRPYDSKTGLAIDSITTSTKYVAAKSNSDNTDILLHCSTDIDGCALSAKWC